METCRACGAPTSDGKAIAIATKKTSGVVRSQGKIASRNRFKSQDGAELRPDQVEFGKAIDDYKRLNRRPFPLASEILDVLLNLGYRKVTEPARRARKKIA